MATRPICPTRGLPQGDPASPLRPTAIMASWIFLVQSELGNNGGAAYLDDRLVWECGRGRAPRLQGVSELSAKCERLYAFEDNAKKRLFFDSIPAGRRSLLKRLPNGKVDEEVTMLGTRYRFDGEGVKIDTTAAMEKAQFRLGRIVVVGGSLQQKRGMAGHLVMPVFSWCSGRMGLAPAGRKLLEKDIERAVMGEDLVGPNRFLMWTVIMGHRISPLFSEMQEALSVTAARQRKQLEGRGTVPPLTGRVIEEVLEIMSWRRDPPPGGRCANARRLGAPWMGIRGRGQAAGDQGLAAAVARRGCKAWAGLQGRPAQARGGGAQRAGPLPCARHGPHVDAPSHDCRSTTGRYPFGDLEGL